MDEILLRRFPYDDDSIDPYDKDFLTDSRYDNILNEVSQDNIIIPKLTIGSLQKLKDEHQSGRNKWTKIQNKVDQQPTTNRPYISEKSERIIQDKKRNGDYKPIYERVSDIQNKKKNQQAEFQRQKAIKEEQQIKQQCTFRPAIKVHQEPRTVDEFLEQVDFWIMKKNEMHQQYEKEKLNRELQGATFRPQINRKSQQLAYENSNSHMSTQQRLQRTTISTEMKGRKNNQENTHSISNNQKSRYQCRSPFNKVQNYYKQSNVQNTSFDINLQSQRIFSKPSKTRSTTPNKNSDYILKNQQECLEQQDKIDTQHFKYIADLLNKSNTIANNDDLYY